MIAQRRLTQIRKKTKMNMKHIWMVLMMAATLTFNACGNGGKPDLDDPKAIAEFSCKKIKEVIELMKDAEANSAKIEALGKEMDDFDQEFKNHHGDKAHEMQLKIDEQLELVCTDLPQGF
jgi:hypothetical protein